MTSFFRDPVKRIFMSFSWTFLICTAYKDRIPLPKPQPILWPIRVRLTQEPRPTSLF